jgi:hypothetical protein
MSTQLEDYTFSTAARPMITSWLKLLRLWPSSQVGITKSSREYGERLFFNRQPSSISLSNKHFHEVS